MPGGSSDRLEQHSAPLPAEPLPVAVFMPYFDVGGTELQTIELIRRLHPARWTVHLACLQPTGPLFARAAEHAASVADFPAPSFRSLDGARHFGRFVRWCRDTRIAVVHATGLPGNIFALPAAAVARVPLRIGSRRGFDRDKTRAHVLAQRAAFIGAHKVVANSRAVANGLVADGVPRRKIVIVSNGVDLPPPASRDPSGPPRIVVIASLRPVKGHDVLVDAAPEVLRRFPDARFELIGGGPLAVSLRASIASRGLSGAFHVAGHCEDVAARLAGAAVCVLPSRSEGLPNALLEAMAAGVPIVATSVGGTPEIVDHSRTGVLVRPGDAAALAAAITAVLADPAAAATMAVAARAYVEANHGWPQIIGEYERLYTSGLAAAAPEKFLSHFRH
ncbi:MAG: glycosyltransferase [Vicinamibacterales bacterium]